MKLLDEPMPVVHSPCGQAMLLTTATADPLDPLDLTILRHLDGSRLRMWDQAVCPVCGSSEGIEQDIYRAVVGGR